MCTDCVVFLLFKCVYLSEEKNSLSFMFSQVEKCTLTSLCISVSHVKVSTINELMFSVYIV